MRSLLGSLHAAGLVCVCIAGCTKESGKPRTSAPTVGAVSAVLATLADGETLADKEAPAGLGLHAAPAGAKREFVFSERGGGVAYAVEKGDKLRVVHNGRAGRPYAAVGEVVLSPDGRRCAYGALDGGKWRMVVDDKEGEPFDTVKMPVFSPDGAHVAYQALSGDLWHLVVDATVNGGTRTRYLNHELAGDSSRIAYIDDVDDRDRGRLVVSDLSFKSETTVDSGASGLLLSADRSTLAAIATSDGQQRAIVARFDRPDVVKRGPKQDAVRGLALAPDGGSLAYVAERSGRRFMVLDDREEPVSPAELVGISVIRPGKSGVGALVASSGSVRMQQFFVEGGRRGADYEDAEGLIYSGDGRSHAYAARRGTQWFAVLNGTEGPPFDRVVSPVFSPDGKWLAYRARKGGRRFVVVAEANGKTMRLHPAYDQVFPVRFTSDGKSAAYGVKDGRVLAWKVEAL